MPSTTEEGKHLKNFASVSVSLFHFSMGLSSCLKLPTSGVFVGIESLFFAPKNNDVL